MEPSSVTKKIKTNTNDMHNKFTKIKMKTEHVKIKAQFKILIHAIIDTFPSENTNFKMDRKVKDEKKTNMMD